MVEERDVDYSTVEHTERETLRPNVSNKTHKLHHQTWFESVSMRILLTNTMNEWRGQQKKGGLLE